jgi:hypothetical protein
VDWRIEKAARQARSGFAEEDFAVADGECDFGEGGDVLAGSAEQRKKLAT